jgi:hypothetical protein
MPHNGIRAMDDRALIAWFIELLEKTPDVYVRTPANGGVSAITPATTLRDGLGIDSIGRLCAFYAIADALGAPSDDDGNGNDDESIVASWSTMGDVLTFVRARAESNS